MKYSYRKKYCPETYKYVRKAYPEPSGKYTGYKTKQ